MSPTAGNAAGTWQKLHIPVADGNGFFPSKEGTLMLTSDGAITLDA